MVYNFPYRFCLKRNYKKCNDSNCSICIFSCKNYQIYLTEKFIFPFIFLSSCNSQFAIYWNLCGNCNFFLIVQSKDIKSWILRHIYDIKSFVKFFFFHFPLLEHILWFHLYSIFFFINHFLKFVFLKNFKILSYKLNTTSIS